MNIHRFYILISFYILLFSKLEAKEEDRVKLNSFNFELGGSGGFYSFNFDRLVPLNKKLSLNLGIGISPQLTYGLLEFALMPAMPINVRASYKLVERHYLDFGFSMTPWYGNNVYFYGSMYDCLFHAQIGYKYYLKNYRNYLGFLLNPAFYDLGFVFEPWVGIRFGYSFNTLENRKIHAKEDTAKIESLSGSLGIVNYKIRLQYEKGHKIHSSSGAMLTLYFGDFPGLRIEGFTRQYHKRQSNREGFFIQEKIGVGYLFSGMYDEQEENISGITVGGGVAGGYKLMIGNHLNVEAILGAHYYIAPIVGKNVYVMYGQGNQKEWWYSTTGLPLDFQFKFGWQY